MINQEPANDQNVVWREILLDVSFIEFTCGVTFFWIIRANQEFINLASESDRKYSLHGQNVDCKELLQSIEFPHLAVANPRNSD